MLDKKEELFTAGRELFCSKGFKDVNVSDITKMAGVAVGTFYNYYSSKEQLFLEIFIEENQKAKRAVANSLDMNADPATIAKDFIIRNMDVMRGNLILKEWYNRDASSELKAYYQKNEETIFSFAQDFFLGLLKRARAEKKIREDIDDKTVLSLIDTLSYLDYHQDEVGVAGFPEVLRLLAEFVINGLTAVEH